MHEAFATQIQANPTAGMVVSKKPPQTIKEIPTDVRPKGDLVSWIPGYWAWDDADSDFIWISGIWRQSPPGRQWVPGCWIYQGNDYQWRAGFWAEGRSGWNWIPEHYVWTPRGAIHVSEYWDLPISARGTLFAPVSFRGSVDLGDDFRYTPAEVVDAGRMEPSEMSRAERLISRES